MSKNTCANRKSSKQRKTRVGVNRPDLKLFSLMNIVCLDNSPSDFKTMWFCKICMKCLLSESAVFSHIGNCKEGTQIFVPEKK